MSLDPSSDTFDALVDQFLPGKYDPPVFALRLAHKDVSLAEMTEAPASVRT